MTCFRRLEEEWQEAGVWGRLHQALLERLGEAERIDCSRASLDSASIPAKKGGRKTGPNPTDKGKPGTKRHVVLNPKGVPLSVVRSAANVHDSMVFEELLEAIKPTKRPRGRPRKRLQKLHAADKAYYEEATKSAPGRSQEERRHQEGHSHKEGVESSEKVGRHRQMGGGAEAVGWVAK